jgi:hypothetical protein
MQRKDPAEGSNGFLHDKMDCTGNVEYIEVGKIY